MKGAVSKINNIKTDIIKFYEDDLNSRLCSGKKEFVVKNTIKRHKRYLNDSMKNLHKIFIIFSY